MEVVCYQKYLITRCLTQSRCEKATEAAPGKHNYEPDVHKMEGAQNSHTNTLKALLQEPMSIKATNPAVSHQVNHSNSLFFLLSLFV